MSDAIKTTGGCQCGHIRFAAAEAPLDASYCHCRMCQRATGGPFGVFVSFHRSAFGYEEAAPATYRSSRVAERSFCPRCGTPIGFRYLDSDYQAVTVGSLDDPEVIAPTGHDGIEGRLSWVTIADGLPQSETALDPARL